MPHHSKIVPIRKVLGYLAIEHPIHVGVLDLEGAPGGLHTNQHPAINWKVRHSQVGTAVSASDKDPLALRDRVQSRQPRVGEIGLDLSQHSPHARTPHLSAVISAVLGEAACCCVEVAAIERLIEFFGYSPTGLCDVQGRPLCKNM